MRIFSYFIITCLFSLTVKAGVVSSLMQTANIQTSGHNEAKLQNDIILSGSTGYNISAHYTFLLYENFLDLEAYLGTGSTNLFTGAMAKYNLFPDIQGQAGLSFLLGLSYLRDDESASVSQKINRYALSTGALGSKAFALSSYSHISPYLAYLLEILVAKSGTIVNHTVHTGVKFATSTLLPWSFYAEFAFKLKNSFNSFNLGVSYRF